MVESLKFERIVPIRDVMTLTARSTQEIEERIKKPVKNKQHFHLLPKVNLLMPDKLCLIVGLAGDPDKDEKR